MNDDRIRVDFIGNVPKQPYPEPEEDWATVDFDAGLDRITIDELRFDTDKPDSRGQLAVTLRILKRDDELVSTGPGFYTYRLCVTFDAPLPGRYVITHLDENGTKQFESTEMIMADPSDYQKNRFDG